MATFSEIVDNVAQDTGEVSPAKLPSVIRVVNNILRDFIGNSDEHQRAELLFEHPTARFNPPNAYEKVSIPLPSDYQKIEVIMTDLDQIVHKVKPGIESAMAKGKNRYYIADGQLHMSACFRHSVSISYFKVRRSFRYFPLPLRLIRTSEGFTHDSSYEYRYPATQDWVGYTPRNPDMEASYNRHVDWVCDLYGHVVELGAASSLHNRKGNAEVGRNLYNQYENQRRGIIAGRI